MDYKHANYYGTREDNSKFLITQIDYVSLNNKKYYKYYYTSITNEGDFSEPIILFSDINISEIVNKKNFYEPIEDGLEYIINNILFSKENIEDSLLKNTGYIGSIYKENNQLIISLEEITKDPKFIKRFSIKSKNLKRSDGTTIFIEKFKRNKTFWKQFIKVRGYNVYEILQKDEDYFLKKNVIYTEKDLFKDDRQILADDFLSRERLDRKNLETGGFLGFLDNDGIHKYHQSLLQYYSTSRRIEEDNIFSIFGPTDKISIPSFEELKFLAEKYDLVYKDMSITDSRRPYDLFEDHGKDLKIKNIETGEIITDDKLIRKATFANIWLISAGIVCFFGEEREGLGAAFNDSSKILYEIMCENFNKDAKNIGVIDTTKLYEDINKITNGYRYNEEIICNLFRTEYQTNFINTLFLNANKKSDFGFSPEPLYNSHNAEKLVKEKNKVQSLVLRFD